MVLTASEPAAPHPTHAPGHRKRSRWWWNHRGNGPVDVLELQPLQESSHRPASVPESTRCRTLELILGLEEPIVARKYNASSGSLVPSPSFLENYFFPPDTPPSIQIWRWSNVCIPICYFTVGIMQGMVRPLLNVYPLDLGATEAQQTTLASIATLPSALKIVFGFWSDNVPIFGYRRKPYMLLGWIITFTSMAILLSSTDLSVPVNPDDPRGSHPQKNLPSMEWLMAVFFVTGCGIWLADVMVDSLIAQKVPMEPLHAQGQMQSSCYAFRFFGLAIASPMSTYLYSNGVYGTSGPASIVMFMAVFPILSVIPLWFLLEEERNIRLPSTMDQCREIWKTICSRAVWQPIGFVYLYNIMQVPNAAWRQYLKSVLLFTSSQLNILLTASFLLLYLGTVIYKHCFIKTSWRRLYYMGFALNVIASLGQMALIRGYTAGLSPFFFALGDDALVEFIVGMQMLPICILMVTLCPPNSEGASYAMFTTAWNSAMLLAQALGGSVLLGIWDTSKETMIAGHLDGLFKLSILTTLLQVSPIVFVWWLPHGHADLQELAGDGENRTSALGGGIFLMVVLSSVVYTVGVTLLNVLAPGWAGES
jgi:BT1 family